MFLSSKRTILFADDNEEIVTLYKHLMEKAGYSVITAKDGEEALEVANKEKPDALVIDITMPKKDGLTVSNEIRATDWGRNVPIIILTGKQPENNELEKVVDIRPTFYLLKGNSSSDDFMSKIKELLPQDD